MILINNIRCEYMENTISITNMRPRFSWEIVSEENNIYQKAYEILYRRILGLQNIGLGYDEILINPIYTCGLEWAEGSYNSVHGEISIRWEKKDENYLVSGKIPANTKATIVLPNGNKKEIGNGKFNLVI